MSQTSYATSMAIAREGSLAQDFGAAVIESAVVSSAAVKYGLLVQRGSTAGTVKPMDALGAADPDAFVLTGVIKSAATAQNIGSASFGGVIGANKVPGYCGRLSMTLDANVDWDQTWATILYDSPSGACLSESIEIPNGGSTTIYTQGYVSMLRRIYISPQSGAGGTCTGVGIDYTMPYVGVDERNFPGVALLSHSEESYAATTEAAVKQVINVLRRGAVWVKTETAVSQGDPVYVRVVAAGLDVRGQFAGDVDETNYARLQGAFWLTSASATGLAAMWVGGNG